jgi:hypothetical protein
MSRCTECGSKRIAVLNADIQNCHIEINGRVYEGDELPDDLGIGGGAAISFDYCLDCGVILSDFPLDDTGIELEEEADGDGQ